MRAHVTTAWKGFGLPLEGARLLLAQRRLWALAVVPMLLSATAFASALGFVVAHAGEIYGWAGDWMPTLEAGRWYAWLWIGPLWLSTRLLTALLFVAISGAALVVAFLVASLLASPFHDALAARVERIVTGDVRDLTGSGVGGLAREALRSVTEEARRLAFYLSVVAPLAVLGFVVPGGQLVTGPLIAAFTIFFLPLDYASYTLDRRHVAFRDKRRWVLDQAPLMAGFGGAAFLICAVPLLNLAAMPLLVVSGTLLVVRYAQPPPGAGSDVSSS